MISGKKISVGVSVRTQGKIMCAKDIYIWIPATCSCKNGKFVGSIIYDSVITCDENVEKTKIQQKLFQQQSFKQKLF